MCMQVVYSTVRVGAEELAIRWNGIQTVHRVSFKRHSELLCLHASRAKWIPQVAEQEPGLAGKLAEV